MKLSREKAVSDLADLLYGAMINCKRPDDLTYAEAILVLNYLGQEYEKVTVGLQDSPASFIQKEMFPSLFVGSADYWQGLDDSEVSHRYDRCSFVYVTAKDIAEKHKSSVVQKVIDIDATKTVLKNQCEGRPFSLIDITRVRFRDQY